MEDSKLSAYYDRLKSKAPKGRSGGLGFTGKKGNEDATKNASNNSSGSTSLLAKYGFAPMNFAKEGTATDIPKHKVFDETKLDETESNEVDNTQNSNTEETLEKKRKKEKKEKKEKKSKKQKQEHEDSTIDQNNNKIPQENNVELNEETEVKKNKKEKKEKKHKKAKKEKKESGE